MKLASLVNQMYDDATFIPDNLAIYHCCTFSFYAGTSTSNSSSNAVGDHSQLKDRREAPWRQVARKSMCFTKQAKLTGAELYFISREYRSALCMFARLVLCVYAITGTRSKDLCAIQFSWSRNTRLSDPIGYALPTALPKPYD